jgi:hypothetical protein
MRHHNENKTGTQGVSMRLKGQRTKRQIERDLPYFVEIFVPGNGLREKHEVMHACCNERVGNDGYATTSRHDRQTVRDYVKFHFRDPQTANAFRRTWQVRRDE